ncbi:MAG: NUDIX domain-containing protein [Candidatus Spechtbacteria bacterium]|nr:NUDIX domain-containing protein [Candidatus Spechtbacteria bacterium]
MQIGNFDMKFTICFPLKDGKVAMIYRHKQPWLNRWNGAGGKIEPGETPYESVCREMMEETEIDLTQASSLRYAGVVTWEGWQNQQADRITSGMFAFVSDLAPHQLTWEEDRAINEGIIAWKPIDWVCTIGNPEIADNVPHFLSHMIISEKPMQYHCVFDDGDKLQRVDVLDLPEILKNTHQGLC